MTIALAFLAFAEEDTETTPASARPAALRARHRRGGLAERLGPRASRPRGRRRSPGVLTLDGVPRRAAPSPAPPGPQQRPPADRPEQLVHRVLGVRHQAEHVARLACHAGDVGQRAVRVLGVAQRDLARGLDALQLAGGAYQAPSWCLTGMRSTAPGARPPTRASRRARRRDHVAADEAPVVVRAQHARQQARLAEHLEAVADAEHGPAGRGERRDLPHHRREARDRAGAQVVAVREAARDDHAVQPSSRSRACQSAHGPPPRRSTARRASRSSHEPGNVITPIRGTPRPPRAPASTTTSYPSIRPFASTRSAASRPPRSACPRLHVNSTSNSRRARTALAGYPSVASAWRDRLALRVEDPLLGPHQHRHLHARTPSRRGSPRTGAGEPLVGLAVARGRAVAHLVGAARGRAASCPRPASPASRARTACRRTAARLPGAYCRPASSATSPASAPRRRATSAPSRRGRTRTSCRRG